MINLKMASNNNINTKLQDIEVTLTTITNAENDIQSKLHYANKLRGTTI